jgi:hypothetical protein
VWPRNSPPTPRTAARFRGSPTKVEANTGRRPKRLLADAGYQSDENLAALDSRGIDAYVAVRREHPSAPPAPAPRGLSDMGIVAASGFALGVSSGLLLAGAPRAILILSMIPVALTLRSAFARGMRPARLLN